MFSTSRHFCCSLTSINHISSRKNEVQILSWRVLPRVLPLGRTTYASGDEDGVIRTWDWRTRAQISEFKEHTDFISDMSLHGIEDCLLAVSGDGSLSVNDLKMHKVSPGPFRIPHTQACKVSHHAHPSSSSYIQSLRMT